MAGKDLSTHPADPSHRHVQDSRLGAYTEVGARTILTEVTMDDYSYVVNDSQITYTTIGRFCSIAAMTRINPGNHPMQRATRRTSPIARAPISRARRTTRNSSPGGARIMSRSATTCGSATARSSCPARRRHRRGDRRRRHRHQGRRSLCHRRRRAGEPIRRRFPRSHRRRAGSGSPGGTGSTRRLRRALGISALCGAAVRGEVSHARLSPSLAHLAARGDRPVDLDLAVADAVDLVDHVGDDAAMVGDDVDDLADLRPSLAERERSIMPCSSETLATTASGYSTTRPKFFT